MTDTPADTGESWGDCALCRQYGAAGLKQSQTFMGEIDAAEAEYEAAIAPFAVACAARREDILRRWLAAGNALREANDAWHRTEEGSP